jgi:hypothetical protein
VPCGQFIKEISVLYLNVNKRYGRLKNRARHKKSTQGKNFLSPFYLMYGREAREPDDLMPPARNRNLTDINMIFSQQWYDAIEIAKNRLEEAKEKQKFYYDRNTKRTVYDVGDIIMLKTMAETVKHLANSICVGRALLE